MNSSYLPRFFGAFIVAALVFGSVAVSFADEHVGLTNTREDSISAHDRNVFAHNVLNQSLGLKFHSHMRVCADPSEEVHCHARVITDDVGVPMASTALPSGFGPTQLLKAYNLSPMATSVARIIAIVDSNDDPNIQKDLDTYSTTFGIPKLPACVGAIANSATPCFKKVNQRGGSYPPRADAGWALEIALDVETAHALCQNCSILLVEADSATFNNLGAAVDRAVILGAKVVSNSYGGSEFSSETTMDIHFNKPGVAFTVSSGDSGYGTEYPASSRYVTAVGGTSLFLNADNSYNNEVAWSGAGSGCSAYETKQVWQIDAGCGRRSVADVSADADPNTGAAIYDSYRYQTQSGWFQVGGTSLASPIIAAVYALSGNIPANVQANSIPYIAPVGSLHDIQTGSNGSCGGTYLCTGFLGFDGPTGLGSPNGTLAF